MHTLDKEVVVHQEDQKRFYLATEHGDVTLDYRMRGEKLMDTLSTYCPHEVRGGGLASIVTRAALDHAKEMGWHVIPSCSYVEAFIRRHDEYKDLLM